jgi:hypothetical protein
LLKALSISVVIVGPLIVEAYLEVSFSAAANVAYVPPLPTVIAPEGGDDAHDAERMSEREETEKDRSEVRRIMVKRWLNQTRSMVAARGRSFYMRLVKLSAGRAVGKFSSGSSDARLDFWIAFWTYLSHYRPIKETGMVRLGSRDQHRAGRLGRF